MIDNKFGTLAVPLALRRDPTDKDFADPRFDILWDLMKRVDVDFQNGLFSGATGNDVCAVLDALDAAKPSADELTALRVPPDTKDEQWRLLKDIQGWGNSVVYQMHEQIEGRNYQSNEWLQQVGERIIAAADRLLALRREAAPVLPSVQEPPKTNGVGRDHTDAREAVQGRTADRLHSGSAPIESEVARLQAEIAQLTADNERLLSGIEWWKGNNDGVLVDVATRHLKRAEAAEASLTQQAQQIATLKEKVEQWVRTSQKAADIAKAGKAKAEHAARVAEVSTMRVMVSELDAILRAATEKE